MGKGGKSEAPQQPITTTNMGQFGSTTNGAFGSAWNPTAFQNSFVDNAQKQMLNAQNALSDRNVSQERVDAMNKSFQQDFSNNMLSPALQKGWLRGSSANDVASIANQNYSSQRQGLIDQEQSRQYQALANALANYTTMFDMAQGVTGLSGSQNQAASNYAMSQAQFNAANKGNIWSTLMGSVGDILKPGIPIKNV